MDVKVIGVRSGVMRGIIFEFFDDKCEFGKW